VVLAEGEGPYFQRSLAGFRTTSRHLTRCNRSYAAVHIMFLKAPLEILKELWFVICAGGVMSDAHASQRHYTEEGPD
jgi:hypothetical protein